jgi:hypothetical protein
MGRWPEPKEKSKDDERETPAPESSAEPSEIALHLGSDAEQSALRDFRHSRKGRRPSVSRDAGLHPQIAHCDSGVARATALLLIVSDGMSWRADGSRSSSASERLTCPEVHRRPKFGRHHTSSAADRRLAAHRHCDSLRPNAPGHYPPMVCRPHV